MLTNLEVSQFKEQGFLIKNILNINEVEFYLEKIRMSDSPCFMNIERMINIQFLQPSTSIKSIHDIICNDKILSVCRSLFNRKDIVLDGASLFYAFYR